MGKKIRRPQAPKRDKRARSEDKQRRIIEQSMYLPPDRMRFVR